MTLRKLGDKQPRIPENAYVDPAAQVIGEVFLGEDTSVWPGAVLRGDIHHIIIGSRTNIQDGSVVHVTHDSEFNPGGHPTIVGAEVTVGHRVVLHGCTIEDRCLIGMGAIVMDGARLAGEVILGAGTLVPPGKQLAGGYLWLGVPARKVRPLQDREREYLAYAADHYVKLKNRYLEQD